MNNTSDLSSQIVLLSTEEEWVSKDRSFEVTSEQNLNLTRSLNIGRGEIWEFGPLLEYTVCDPVGKLINTSSFSFLISRATFTLASFFTTFNNTFSDIIVFLRSRNLAKEADRTCARLLGKCFQTSLYSPCFNLAEADASPLIDFGVGDQISNVTNRTDLLCLSFTTFFAFLTGRLFLNRIYDEMLLPSWVLPKSFRYKPADSEPRSGSCESLPTSRSLPS